MRDEKFDLRDISIIPTIVSEINSRSECKTTEDNFLPLMAAPMDTVVCTENAQTFINNQIMPCLPRGEYATGDLKLKAFQSYGLYEIESQLIATSEDTIENPFHRYKHVLIDIANGHMQRLVDVVKEIKQRYPDIELMVGNVAHPLTFKNLALAGADYVRCSIGTGAGCTTAANVAINYPMGSLIHECRKEKIKGGLWDTKIVADGGMQGYDDIIKALALGADYVMIGSLFNKAMESAGFNYWKTWFGMIRIKNYILAKNMWERDYSIYKKYRGMSTKAVQRKWGRTQLVTAEGITKYQKIEYNISQWKENFEDYLKSNMSYCGARRLHDFVGYAEWVYITNNALKRFQK